MAVSVRPDAAAQSCPHVLQSLSAHRTGPFSTSCNILTHSNASRDPMGGSWPASLP